MMSLKRKRVGPEENEPTLTPEQVKLLNEYADEVVLCYDSDEAGQKATARAIELFGQSPVKISVLNIPDAKDPDEFIKKYGPEKFAQLLNGSAGAIEYELEKRRAKYDLARPDGRVGYLKEAIGVLAANAVTATERDVYAGRLAEQTDVDKAAILTQLAAAVKAQGYRQRARKQKELLAEGNAGRVKVPYSQGGAKALGVAFAQQQLLAVHAQHVPVDIHLVAQLHRVAVQLDPALPDDLLGRPAGAVALLAQYFLNSF